MGYVILVRNPGNDSVVAITKGEDVHETLVVFATENEADEAAVNIKLCQAWPYAIVEAP